MVGVSHPGHQHDHPGCSPGYCGAELPDAPELLATGLRVRQGVVVAKQPGRSGLALLGHTPAHYVTLWVPEAPGIPKAGPLDEPVPPEPLDGQAQECLLDVTKLHGGLETMNPVLREPV